MGQKETHALQQFGYGKIERGFDFLGYRFDSQVWSKSPRRPSSGSSNVPASFMSKSEESQQACPGSEGTSDDGRRGLQVDCSKITKFSIRGANTTRTVGPLGRRYNTNKTTGMPGGTWIFGPQWTSPRDTTLGSRFNKKDRKTTGLKCNREPQASEKQGSSHMRGNSTANSPSTHDSTENTQVENL